MPIRTPDFDGTTSEGDWGRPNFEDYVNGYFRNNPDADQPEDETIDSVDAAPQALLNWAASITFAGDAEGDTFDEVVVLPAVVPETMALHEDGVEAVLSRAPQVEGLSEDDVEEVQSRARTLLEDEFGRDLEEDESSLDVGVQLKTDAEMKAPTPGYPTKATGTVKQVDTSTRTVTGYYASFGNVDADREEFAPGAFERTIQRRGPQGSGRIKHLWQHDATQPIGVPEVLREDENGLYFETRIVDTQKGTDALKLYEEGVITEHSVGFNRIDQEPREDGSTLITEVQLWEGSSVTWGANPQTPTTGIKAQNGYSKETLTEKLSAAQRVLKRDLTEGTAAQLEIMLKQIEGLLREEEEDEKTVITLTSGGWVPSPSREEPMRLGGWT